MLIAKSFASHREARDFFTTCAEEGPLIVQFGASNSEDFANAAAVLAGCPVDGVDLNCGCPQGWVMKEGFGAALLRRPENIANMVREARSRCELPISVKIRVNNDPTVTVELARRAEAAGAAFVTVHGRTPQQRTGVVPDYGQVKLVRESLGVPVVHNGSIFDEDDVARVFKETGVAGVMAARGALKNPALFYRPPLDELQSLGSGKDSLVLGVPSLDEVVARFLELSLKYGSNFACVHHHLMFMMHGRVSRADKQIFNTLQTLPGIF